MLISHSSRRSSKSRSSSRSSRLSKASFWRMKRRRPSSRHRRRRRRSRRSRSHSRSASRRGSSKKDSQESTNKQNLELSADELEAAIAAATSHVSTMSSSGSMPLIRASSTGMSSFSKEFPIYYDYTTADPSSQSTASKSARIMVTGGTPVSTQSGLILSQFTWTVFGVGVALDANSHRLCIKANYFVLIT